MVSKITEGLGGVSDPPRRPASGDPQDLVRRVVDLRVLQRSLLATMPDGVDRARHAEALAALEEKTLRLFLFQQEMASGRAQVTVAVVGDFSSGKSTFINALLGENLCPVDVDPTTSSVSYFSHGPEERFEREYEEGGRQQIDRETYRATVRHLPTEETAPHTFHVTAPVPQLEGLRLIDTPGFNNPKNESVDTAATQRAAAAADALFVVMDIRKGNLTITLLERLEELRAAAKDGNYETPAFLLLNQADLQRSRAAQRKVREKNEKKHGALFRKVLLVSSKQLNEGMDQGVVDAINAHVERIKEAILKRERFDVHLVGQVASEGTAAFVVDVDGCRHTLSMAPDDLLVNRAGLSELLDELRSERHRLLDQKEKRDGQTFRKEWRCVLTEFVRYLRSARVSLQANPSQDEDEQLASFISQERACVSQLLLGLVEESVVLSLETDSWVDEGWLSNTDHYRIFWTRNAASACASSHSNWDQIAQVLDTLAEQLSECFGVPLSIDHVKYRRSILRRIKEFDRELAEASELAPGEHRTEILDETDQELFQGRLAEMQSMFAQAGEEAGKQAIEEHLTPVFDEIRDRVQKARGRTQAASFQRQAGLDELCDRAKKLVEDIP